MNQTYDNSTDSLYLEVRPLPSRRTVEIEEKVFLDLGEDGDPVGYDIQHASGKTELVRRLMREYDYQARSTRVE
jgi:uncharacterized protein YuzE